MQIDTIQKKIDETKDILKVLKQRSSSYSMQRGILILLALFALFRGYYYEQLFYMLCVLSLGLFLYIAAKHRALKQKIEDHEVMMEVLQDILRRKNSGWKAFKDNGAEFLQEENTQAYDLDLLGDASLYQYLCVAKTVYGRARLAELLSARMQSRKDMRRRSAAVQECARKTSFTLSLTRLLKLYERHGQRKKRSSMEDILKYMEEEQSAYPNLVRILCTLLSGLTIAALLLFLAGVISYAYALALSMLSLCLSLLFFMKHAQQLSSVAPLAHLIEDYERMFHLIEETSFQSEALCRIREDVKEACAAIKRLRTVLMMVQLRSNSILFFVVNALGLLDFQCVMALQSWKQRYGKTLRIWLEDIGELEAYSSLAQLTLAKEATCIPDCTPKPPYLKAEHVVHPLLEEGSAVDNSITIENGTYIITGSNMSGKTTFLRTLGINLVLMHAGASVCAASFCAGSMNLYTSMRVHDNVSEGISTFYAEILRIQNMNEASRKQEPMLVLIDEIFKGTNSADRIYCATSAIRHLHQPWIITMISTHDFELCELNNDPMIHAVNYHFSEYYENERICFDYRLKEGKCTTTNARELMRLAGFKEETDR